MQAKLHYIFFQQLILCRWLSSCMAISGALSLAGTALDFCAARSPDDAALIFCSVCSLADAALVLCSVCSPHVYGPQPDSIPLFAGAKTTIQSRANT